MDAVKRQWMNRPAHELQLGLDEWTQLKQQAEAPAVPAALALPVQAGRGSHTAGEMNKLEMRYEQHLRERVLCGEVLWFMFESVKLRLAPATFYTFDFLVALPNGTIEAHEVKGHWEDDARVKIKVAARMFIFWKFVGIMWDKQAKGWTREEFRA